MKTIDCIEQLTKQVKICNEVYQCSSRMADVLDKNYPIAYDDIRKQIVVTKEIFFDLYYLHTIEIIPIHEEFENCFNIQELKDYLVQMKTDFTNIPDSISYMLDRSRIKHCYDKIDSVLSKNNIEQVKQFLYSDIVNIDASHLDIVNIIFKRCIKARNLLIEYCNSLDLPDKSDWEVYNK